MSELEQSTAQDQPKEESKETEQDQAAKDDGDVIELDGEKLTPQQIKEYKAGYMRQQDYTKKTQELAQAKREIARSGGEEKPKGEELDPEVKAALEALKKAGVATKDDLLLMKAQEADQKEFRRMLKTYPDLLPHKKALKQIGLSDNRAWVDIAKDYGFLDEAKLAKAKASQPVKGVKSSPTSEAPKDLPKAGTPEWDAWKAANLGQGKWA